MDDRTNLLSLLRRKGYERAPYKFSLCPSLVEKMKEVTGNKHYSEYFGFPDFGVDIGVPPEFNRSMFEGFFSEDTSDVNIDQWGIGHRHGSAAAQHMTQLVYPLKGIDSFERIKEYPFLDYSKTDVERMRKQVAYGRACGKATSGTMASTIWETAWQIRSMEDLMVDLLEENEIGDYILEKVYQTSMQRIKLYAEAGVDMIWLGDDVGMQKNIMISKDMYETYLKPRMINLIREAKRINPDVLIVYHSCGYVLPFIEDFIEEGIDVLHPVQPESMDFKDVFEQYGGRISFWGSIGTQTTMPFATPQEVEDTVRRNLDIAGEYGGLFCAPTHLLEPEVPIENILAYVRACRNYK